MSDFFEPDTTALAIANPAGAVDREMRRQELRRAANRKWATGVIGVALAGTLVLGGGFAAYAASHPSPSKSAASVSKTHAKAVKHKHKKHKHA